MRAWVISHFGEDGLALVDRPDPVAGPGQVVVSVAAVSLNYRDRLMLLGDYNPRQPLPLVPCSDGAGVVLSVGPGVTRVRPGDRVMGLFSQAWIDGAPTRERLRSTLGGPLDGMLAEQVLLSAEGVVSTPARLTDEEAATLPCAAVTAWNALVELGRLEAGHTLLVQGTGGVSIFALQFGVLAGARVIVTSSSDDKLARAKALGAWQTINYVTTPDWDKAARAITEGVGVDHVLEVGGAGTIGRSLRAVRIGGTVSVIGVLSGKTSEVALTPIFMQHLKLQGLLVGSRTTFERMNDAIVQHGLHPVVDARYRFADAPAAFGHLASGRHFGKIVVSTA